MLLEAMEAQTRKAKIPSGVPAGVKNHGVAFTLSSSTFSRDHYTQDGWSTEDGGAKVYELGGSYTTNAALTLYPHWTPANYTVTWHVGDATSTSTVAYNTDFQDITVGKPAVTNSSLSSCEQVTRKSGNHVGMV